MFSLPTIRLTSCVAGVERVVTVHTLDAAEQDFIRILGPDHSPLPTNHHVTHRKGAVHVVDLSCIGGTELNPRGGARVFTSVTQPWGQCRVYDCMFNVCVVCIFSSLSDLSSKSVNQMHTQNIKYSEYDKHAGMLLSGVKSGDQTSGTTVWRNCAVTANGPTWL